MTRLTGFALLALAFAAPALPSQKSKPAKDWISLGTCSAGSDVRVTLADGASVRGAFVSASADSLVVKTKKGERALARQDVKRARVKAPGRRLRHALIGLAVGAAAGVPVAAFAHARRSNECSSFCAGPDVWHIVTVASVPVTAVLAGLVGAALPAGGWKEIYRAP